MELSLDEILAELDELGRAKFEAAQLMAANKKLVAYIADLEQGIRQLPGGDPAAESAS